MRLVGGPRARAHRVGLSAASARAREHAQPSLLTTSLASAPATLHYVKGTFISNLYQLGTCSGNLVPRSMKPALSTRMNSPTSPTSRLTRRPLHAPPPLHCHGAALPQRAARSTTETSIGGSGGDHLGGRPCESSDGRGAALVGTSGPYGRLPATFEEGAAQKAQGQHAWYVCYELL